jgi:hypothetical protein
MGCRWSEVQILSPRPIYTLPITSASRVTPVTSIPSSNRVIPVQSLAVLVPLLQGLAELTRTHGANILQQPVEKEGIARKRLEAEIGIELPGWVVLRVDEQGTDTSNIGDLECPPHGVSDKGGPKALALPMTLHGKAGEKNGRDRITWNALGKTLWRILIIDAADNERVIPNDRLPDGGDIRLRDIRALASECVEADKTVQRLIATIKARRIVRERQFSDAGLFIHTARFNPREWVRLRGAPCEDADAAAHQARP